MEEKIRKTGINIIGDAPWGTHFCQFYLTKEDLIDTLVPYFKAGLENNEFCMWITSEPLGVDDATRSLKKEVKNLDDYFEKDQIEILDYTQWYTRSGKFEAEKVLQSLVEKEEQAIKKGFDGLRLTGNTLWLEKKDWKNFTDYEEEINNVIGQHRMMAICTYSLARCGIFEVIDIINNHQFALIRKEGNWEIIESSERKRAWEAFRGSEEKLSSFIDSATESFVLYDSELNLIEINKKALELFPDETTKEDLIGKNILEISPGLEKTGRYDKYCEVIKTGKPIYFDDVVPGHRFGNRHLSVRAFRVVEGLGLIFSDITERKRVEEKLKQSEELLKHTQEISHVGSWSLDLENNELIWSDEAYKIFGIKSQEFKANYETFLETVHPDDRAMVDQTYTNAVKNKKPYEVVHRVLRPNGEVRTVHERSMEIFDKTGKAILSYGMVQDITEYKKVEEALKNAAEEKETLLKEAHHRIKNNFSLVSSLLRMQLAKIKDPDDLEIFKESQNRVLIMARLHEILYQGEITGKVNMKAYLTKIISSLCGSYKIDSNRIKVKSSIDELELNSRTATSCGLIVNELFTNAYKYSFPDGRKGEINITLRSLEGDEIELIITDNGVGLPENVDFRDTETLGLHIVKMLAEDQHHGEIKLDRTKGTSFHIRMRIE
jgi:hypothetical protein